jgi:hypothetical protein
VVNIVVVTRSTPGAADPSPPLADVVRPFGLAIEPLHPGTTDPLLSTFHQVNAPDLAQAQEVVERLRAHPLVDSAYIKPGAEPP